MENGRFFYFFNFSFSKKKENSLPENGRRKKNKKPNVTPMQLKKRPMGWPEELGL